MQTERPLEIWFYATPNGWKITIMLEELRETGIALPEVEVHTVDIMNREQFSDAFTAVNPNQKIPALRHGDVTLMESGALLLYLAERYPSPLLPTMKGRWEVLQWLYWQVANLGPVFGNKLSYTRYITDVPEAHKAHPLARFSAEAQRLLRVLNRQLEERDYICGSSFTIADIACFPWVRGWKWSKIDITPHGNVVDWLRRVRARPGVDRGLAYGAAENEVDRWSEATRQRYAAGGASIASNEHIAAGD